MENMKNKGYKFVPGKVEEWLDCGNKNSTVYTNQRMLEIKKNQVQLIHPSAKNNNSVIIEPCYLGEGVELNNSVVGPHVSLGKGTKVNGTIISNSIVQNNTVINQSNISNSMLGSHVVYSGKAEDLSIGDYSTHE